MFLILLQEYVYQTETSRTQEHVLYPAHLARVTLELETAFLTKKK